MGSHAHMVVPPSFSALYARVIVIQGLCKPLIKKWFLLTVNFRL
jgi:hypothetical protein